MFRYFRLITRRTTKKVFKVELYETVRGIRMEEESFIGFRLTKRSNKTLNGEITIHEKSFNRWANVKLHEMTISENLLVSCSDNLFGLRKILICLRFERDCHRKDFVMGVGEDWR